MMKPIPVSTLDIICDTEKSLVELQKRIDLMQEQIKKLKYVQSKIVSNFDIKMCDVEFDQYEQLAYDSCSLLNKL